MGKLILAIIIARRKTTLGLGILKITICQFLRTHFAILIFLAVTQSQRSIVISLIFLHVKSPSVLLFRLYTIFNTIHYRSISSLQLLNLRRLEGTRSFPEFFINHTSPYPTCCIFTAGKTLSRRRSQHPFSATWPPTLSIDFSQTSHLHLNNRLFPLCPCVCIPSSPYSPTPSRPPCFSFAEEREFVAVARSRVFRTSPAPIGLTPREAVIRNKNASTGGIYAN